MADLIKLDMTQIWATNGDKTQPSDAKIQQGWVVEAVPRQTWNWFENRQDQNIAYMLQKGLPEWDTTTQYIANKSYVQRSNIVYKCIQTNINQDPAAANSTYWRKAFTESSAYLELIRDVAVTANTFMYVNASKVATNSTISAYALTLLDDADAATARATLSAQALNTNLTALSGATAATNGLPYFTSTSAMAVTNFTGFARTLLDDADAATMRATLGLGTAAVAALTVGNADGTTGRVQTVGDYGWGAGSNGLAAMDPPSGDANLCTLSGVYRISSTTTNIPAGFGQGATMITLMWNNATGAQIITQNGSSAMRGGSNLATTPTWTNWLGTWNTNNLVKTTSATDTTAGSMLKVGDFGVGGDAPTITDANGINASGFYKGVSSASNIPVAAAFVLIHSNYNSGGAGQIFFSLATGDTYTRTQSAASTYTAWVKTVNSGNIQPYLDIAVATAASSAANLYLPKAGGTMTGTLIIDNPTSGNMAIEIGSKTRANTPFIDFNSSTGGTDYDSRILASGGSTTVGQGGLAYVAGGGHSFTGPISQTGSGSITSGSGGFIGNLAGILTGSIASSTIATTQAAGTSNTFVATTAFVANAVSGLAASGANSDITSLSGLTTALSVAQGGTGTTTSTGTGSTVRSVSPALTGTPTVPTAAVGTNTTQAASTAYVQANAVTRAGFVGTVSQSGGTPTGAIIERGSNANGEYVRYADGTQICWLNRVSSISFGNVYAVAGGNVYYGTSGWTYPIAFATGTTPISQCSVTVGGRVTWSSLLASTATTNSFYLINSVNETASATVQLITIGRWF